MLEGSTIGRLSTGVFGRLAVWIDEVSGGNLVVANIVSVSVTTIALSEVAAGGVACGYTVVYSVIQTYSIRGLTTAAETVERAAGGAADGMTGRAAEDKAPWYVFGAAQLPSWRGNTIALAAVALMLLVRMRLAIIGRSILFYDIGLLF